MRVLSLFDGISCGQIALNRAGIRYDKYYASEIDKYAIKITQKNYPNTIQLGDIKEIKDKLLPKIDLLIGGSPCQGFSFAGKQLNFNDPRSKLFFIFVDILNHIKKSNPNVKFLLENVRMKKEYQNIISKYLGVEPVKINSSLVSAQNRVRLYWTNIGKIEQPEDKRILLKDVLENKKNNKKVAIRDKSKTIRSSGRDSYDKHEWDSIGDKNTNLYWRKLTVIECERLQTVPDNYTAGVSNIQRYKMLGNGWTIDVIVHILKGVKE